MFLKPISGAKGATGLEQRTREIALSTIGLALLALPFFVSAICAQTSDARSARPPNRELTDEMGRKVRVPQEVNRVVSLAPNLTEIVFALGDANHLAGDTDYCDYPPEAAKKPHVGGPVNPNLEAIAALMPDLVLATKSINRRETTDALDRIGLPVYITTEPHTVDEVIASLEHLGPVLGVEKSATELAGNLRERLAKLAHRLEGVSPRRVFFVVWTEPLITAGRDTFLADAVRLAGGRSVVDTSAEWPRISIEEIVHQQPEFLVFASARASDTQQDIDALRARPGWKDLAAMQNGKIVVVSDAINRPAPRMIDAIETLARALHPEAFGPGTAPQASLNATMDEICACAR
jgi:iron complex transport system substrate-binding protein